MDLISVIVPVYNVEKYLERCVESIINQTYKNLEIILVDDGSPDNCGAICDEYAKKDERIKVIHKENGGLSSARNAGLDIATGDYIGFVDSDDFIALNMYEVLYKTVSENCSDVSVCNGFSLCENDNNEKILYKNRCSTVLSGEEFINCFFCCSTVWNKLYKKYIFDGVRFPNGKLHEDEFVFHKIFLKCNFVSYVDIPLYYYVKNDESITNSKYSVRRLDVCYALIDRTIDMLNFKFVNLAEMSMISCISMYVYALNRLEKDEYNMSRLDMLKKDIDESINSLLKENITIKSRIRFILFYLSPQLYNIIVKFLGVFIKRRKND